MPLTSYKTNGYTITPATTPSASPTVTVHLTQWELSTLVNASYNDLGVDDGRWHYLVGALEALKEFAN